MSHLGDLLGAYLDGELEAFDRARVSAHLEDCTACRVELGDIEWARSAVRNLPLIEPPPSLLGDLVGSRRRRRPMRWSRWAWAVSAVSAVALTIGLLIAPGQVNSPFDIGTLVDQHVARMVVDPGVSTIRGPVSGP